MAKKQKYVNKIPSLLPYYIWSMLQNRTRNYFINAKELMRTINKELKSYNRTESLLTTKTFKRL